MRCWVLGEFTAASAALEALTRLRGRGFEDLDAHTPWPVEGMDEVLGLRPSGVRVAGLIAGLLGGAGAYAVQWYTNAISYPINVGGRPLHAWPAFIPITFELLVLCAALAIFFTLLITLRLPQVHHAVFELDAFRSSSVDRFWVSVRVADAAAREEASSLLRESGATQLAVVDEREVPR